MASPGRFALLVLNVGLIHTVFYGFSKMRYGFAVIPRRDGGSAARKIIRPPRA
jgi:hypothetical protein